jgi:hypothetical protein
MPQSGITFPKLLNCLQIQIIFFSTCLRSVVLRSPVNIVIRDEMAKNAWILPLVHYIPTWLLICLSKFFLPKRPHGDLSKYNGTRTSEMQCHKY